MNCNDFENRISGYLDGELSDQEMKQFEQHITSCSKCAALVSEMESLDNILHEMEEPLPDEAYWGGFDARLSEKVDKASSPRPWWNIFTRFNKTQWALAAIVILLVIAFPFIWEITFSHKSATLPRQEAKISTPASDIKTADITTEKAMENGKRIVAGETEEKVAEESEPEAPGELAMKESATREPLKEKRATVAGKPNGLAVKADSPFAPLAPPDSGVDALPRKKPVVASADNVVSAGRIHGAVTTDRVAEIAPSRHLKSKPIKRETAKSRDRVAFKYGDEGALSCESDKKGKSAPVVSTKTSKFYRRAPGAVPLIAPAPKLAARPAPPAESGGGGIIRDGRKALEHKKKDADGLPASESFDDFNEREETGEESVEINDYLATSEVVLIKIVSMPETKTGLKLIRNVLSRANYVENLNNNAERFKKDPLLRKHTKAMQGITNEVMNIKPAEIRNLKRKVIGSGLIEQTKEIGK